MEFRHLRCFVVLAEELHFGRAAQRLAMTQPPLSVNIRQLEDDVGARLFERRTRQVALTAAGLALLPRARGLLAQAEEARSVARDVGAGAAGRLRIGFVGSMLFRSLPQLLRRFQADSARVEVVLHELNSQEQIDALLAGELDLGFLHSGSVGAPLEAIEVDREPFVACLPAGHRLARRKAIALAALAEDTFVLFSRAAAPDYHARIVEICHAAGFHPRVRHEVRHWLSVAALVGQGTGVSLVPAPLARSGIEGAVFRPLERAVVPSTVLAVWHQQQDQPARDRLLRLVRAAPARGARGVAA